MNAVQSKTLKIISVLLFISLAGNVFLGGIIVGRTIDRATPAWVQKDQQLENRLSAQDRAALDSVMSAQKPVLANLKTALDVARKDVRRALDADDPAALDAALQRERMAKAALLRQMRDARHAAWEKLSPEGREALKDAGVAVRERVKEIRRQTSDMVAELPFDLGGPDDFDDIFLLLEEEGTAPAP
ncbi:MAG: periplasmic heavy metal sensor [Alphaproteobacteria bacterium]|nr:periplasmic heavy metal sensor [Alphaproteobacteria bacterium]